MLKTCRLPNKKRPSFAEGAFQRRGRDLNIIPSMGAHVPEQKTPLIYRRSVSAERAGFEPAFPFGKHALQACALNQATRPLRLALNTSKGVRAGELYHADWWI